MSKDFIHRYAFKAPMLFEGDRGSGKTHDARAFASEKGFPLVELAGHESVESIDFLGHIVHSAQGAVWKDGKLSQAFRMAASGIKTVLLIDEILRIPQRQLSVLLSALSPDPAGLLKLQTGRMVGEKGGVGIEEEISASPDMLCIMATTNCGPEFAIDDMDPAIAERFIISRKDTDKERLADVLGKKAALKGFSALTASKLVEFFDKTRRMVDTGSLNRHATMRTLSRAIDLADAEDDVAQVLRDQILLWIDRDGSGRPEKNQARCLNAAIDLLFEGDGGPMLASWENQEEPIFDAQEPIAPQQEKMAESSSTELFINGSGKAIATTLEPHPAAPGMWNAYALKGALEIVEEGGGQLVNLAECVPIEEARAALAAHAKRIKSPWRKAAAHELRT